VGRCTYVYSYACRGPARQIEKLAGRRIGPAEEFIFLARVVGGRALTGEKPATLTIRSIHYGYGE
jgi:hypothetical protein